MSSAKTVAKNTAFLFTADVVGRVISFLLVIIIARKLGDFGLGQYSFAFSFVGLFSILADLGINTYMVREIAKDKKVMKTLFMPSLSLRLILAIVTFFIPVIGIFFLGKGTETLMLVWIASISLFFGNLSTIMKTLFQGFERMGYYSLIDLTERISTFFLGGTVLYLGLGIFPLFWALTISYALAFLVGLIIMLRKFTKIYWVVDLKKWKQLLTESLPFWFTMLFMSIYFNIGNVILSAYQDFSVVGWYNAAYKIVMAVFFIPLVLTAVVFPTLSKFYVKQKNLQKKLYEKSYYYMLVLAVPMTVGGIYLAQPLINTVYTIEFAEAAIALKILLLSIGFIFVNYLMGFLLHSINKQKMFMGVMFLTSMVNIAANLILIPLWSYKGTAAAIVVTEVITFALLSYLTWKNKFLINFPKLLLKPLIAALAMLAVLVWLSHAHVAVLVIAGVITYGLILAIIGGIGEDEWKLAKELLPF